MGNAGAPILKNEDVLIVQGKDVSEIGEAGEIKESFPPIVENVPKSERGNKIVDRIEFIDAL